MGSQASISNIGERYMLSINGQPVTSASPNNLVLKEENVVLLVSLDGGLNGTDLIIDSRLINDKYRPKENPKVVEWKWRREEPSERHILRLHIKDDGEYFFEINSRGPGEGADTYKIMIDEIRGFYIDQAYSRFSAEIVGRITGWLNHIDAHWRKFEPILWKISLSPHHSLSKRRVKKPIKAVESIDPGLMESIVSELEGLQKEEGKEGSSLDTLFSGLPLRVSVEEKYLDYDVVENRMLKSHLKALTSSLGDLYVATYELDKHLRKRLKRSEGDETVETAKEFLANYETIRDIDKLKSEIEGRINDPSMAFLDGIEPHGEPFVATPTLTSHPHYSRFYSRLKSYEEAAPPPLIRIDPTMYKELEPGSLYARWCGVKIFETLMDLGYKIEVEGMVWLEGDEVRVDECKEVVLACRDVRVRIAFERLYENEPPYGSYSTPKKAAIAVEVFRGDAVPTVIVFEPRYDPKYTEEKFGAEDLDKLHVLHDSIVDLRTDRREGLVAGSFVLHTTVMKPIEYGDLGAISLKPGLRSHQLIEILEELISRA